MVVVRGEIKWVIAVNDLIKIVMGIVEPMRE
jgi:hypothetical protein